MFFSSQGLVGHGSAWLQWMQQYITHCSFLVQVIKSSSGILGKEVSLEKIFGKGSSLEKDISLEKDYLWKRISLEKDYLERNGQEAEGMEARI